MQGSIQYPKFELFGYSTGQDTMYGDAYNLFPILLSSKNGNIIDKFSQASKIDHINIESDQHNEDVILVIGKSISKKLYIKYLQQLLESGGKVMLSYELNNYFNIDLDGNNSGHGLDLGFTYETD